MKTKKQDIPEGLKFYGLLHESIAQKHLDKLEKQGAEIFLRKSFEGYVSVYYKEAT